MVSRVNVANGLKNEWGLVLILKTANRVKHACGPVHVNPAIHYIHANLVILAAFNVIYKL